MAPLSTSKPPWQEVLIKPVNKAVIVIPAKTQRPKKKEKENHDSAKSKNTSWS
jgi:hypothetical protein